MNFYHEVYRIVRRIPRGKVATYGQIAAMISTPRAARVVGFALRALPEHSGVPWHRVMNSHGVISIENIQHPQEEQAGLLEAEGVRVERIEHGYRVDLEKYLWHG